MAHRTVTDSAGRMWTCTADNAAIDRGESTQGRDVILACATPSVTGPVSVTVGWQWERMAAPGLARIINLASPVPRR